MEGTADPTDNSIDLRSDNEIDAGAQVDASVTLAAIFGPVSFPAGMPDYQIIAILDRAERERDAAGDFLIDNQMSADNAKARQQNDERQGTDNVSLLIQIVQQDQAEREREHERQWMETSHTYAGQTLDAAQWKQMMNWFSNDENVAQWEDAMMAETGQTREEVRRTGGKMKRFYDLMDKDAKGTLTKDERTEFSTLQADKEVRRGVEVQEEIQGLRQHGALITNDESNARLDGDQDQKTRQTARLARDDIGLPVTLADTAPITASYNKVSEGKMAAKKPSNAPSTPSDFTIRISPDNMFG